MVKYYCLGVICTLIISCDKGSEIKSNIQGIQNLSENITETIDYLQNYIEGSIVIPESTVGQDAELIISSMDNENNIVKIKSVDLSAVKDTKVDFTSDIPITSDQTIQAYIVKNGEVIYDHEPQAISPFDIKYEEVINPKRIAINLAPTKVPFKYDKDEMTRRMRLQPISAPIINMPIENISWVVKKDHNSKKENFSQTPSIQALEYKLDSKSNVAKGYDGCNNFIAQYKISHKTNKILFSKDRMKTRPECNKHNERLNSLLSRASMYSMNKEKTEHTLYDDKQDIIETFVIKQNPQKNPGWISEIKIGHFAGKQKKLPIQKLVSNKEAMKAYFSEAFMPSIDFNSNSLLIFAWQGSGQDLLTYEIHSENMRVEFNIIKGKTKDLRQHRKAFIINNNATFNRVFK